MPLNVLENGFLHPETLFAFESAQKVICLEIIRKCGGNLGHPPFVACSRCLRTMVQTDRSLGLLREVVTACYHLCVLLVICEIFIKFEKNKGALPVSSHRVTRVNIPVGPYVF